ncbi:hypothetical protein C1645_737107 [Glomus cerebriforme]|uniref:Uncharacterized protein n=1 Tax=Glomus cerebriforme TaxID=658196 RepID=A0A397T8S6_9GLOM|nr:hypothetical protein C1645_737107 [Glomus cerebriforme]
MSKLLRIIMNVEIHLFEISFTKLEIHLLIVQQQAIIVKNSLRRKSRDVSVTLIRVSDAPTLIDGGSTICETRYPPNQMCSPGECPFGMVCVAPPPSDQVVACFCDNPGPPLTFPCPPNAANEKRDTQCKM